MSSGQFMIRMPPSLHAALTEKARTEGVSLNQLAVALLAGAVGFKLDP